MDLIERYVRAVSGRLPAAKRDEVEAELRSSILDALEGRGGAADREEDVVPVLEELGDPATVAAAYHPGGQYLIGPELYPTFRRVLGLVLTAVVVLTGLAFVARLVNAGGGLDFRAGELFMWAVERGVRSAIMAAVVVLVVFVVMQHGGKALKQPGRKAFDPRRLPALLHADRANRLDAGFSLAITALVLVVVGAIGGATPGDVLIERPTLSVLAGSFLENLGILMVSLLLEGLMWTAVLIEGRWRLWTRALRSLSDVVAMVAFARFALVVGAERVALEGVGLPPEGVTILELSLWITVASIAAVAIGREWSDYRRRKAELSGRTGGRHAGPGGGPPTSPTARTATA